nr:PMS1 protein homolog 1 isoform X2 [Hydra vulgaris]
MNKLPLSTVELITSTQVIISLVSVVKELVENSLDSGCDSIDVRLDENGLSKIEVQDNGTGIALEDIQYVCKQHYTSKIRNELDLLNLTQYGFRGEALFSICSVGDVFITTKTKADQVSKKYSFSKYGEIISSEITHHNVGTIVTVLNLFKALPVRRKLYENNRKVREEVKCIEELLISYGIAMPKLRITLKYDKNIIWRKDRAANCSLVLSALFGSNVLNNLKEIEYKDEELQVKAYIPKVGSASNVVGRTLADRMFIIVNKRPVRSKEIKSLLKTSYNNNCCQGKYPFSVLMIEVKPDQIDVNLHPNKMDILLQNTDILLEKLNKLLASVYSQSITRPSETDKKLEADQQINIIGNLPNTCLWVVLWKNELFCVDKIRSSEMLLYKKMYETHQLTQNKLIHPIKLNFEFLGENLFQKLSHIETDAVSGCLGRTIANLLNNGFSLRYVKKSNSKEDYFECTHMNDVIPGYGIDDLLQILEYVDIFSDKATSVIRTERACSWFKNEATRLSQISTVCSREEFEMHFNQWILIEDISWQDRLCFHGRPIVMYINKITESSHS